MIINELPEKYKDYDKETLNHLHDVLLFMFKDFVKICDENNIKYFVLYGTNIGAVRHKGFIPWDEEIDIGVLRQDYEKLIKILEDYDEKYYIYNWKHQFGVDNSCYTPQTLFCLKNTRLKNILEDFGIYIDITVVDDIPENNFHKFLFIKILQFVYWGITIDLIIQRDIYFSKNKERIGHCIRFMYKYINFSNFFAKIFTKLIKHYEDKSNEVCTYMSYEISFPKSFFKNVLPIEFEDMVINMPEGYDEILKLYYGNYMEVPPKNERNNHNWEIIDFGKY